jgi:hypothetical protein
MVVADAHRGDGQHFVARSDEKLTAFIELESAIQDCREFFLTRRRDFLQTQRRYTDLNLAEDCLLPALGSSSLPDPQPPKQPAGTDKGRTI